MKGQGGISVIGRGEERVGSVGEEVDGAGEGG